MVESWQGASASSLNLSPTSPPKPTSIRVAIDTHFSRPRLAYAEDKAFSWQKVWPAALAPPPRRLTSESPVDDLVAGLGPVGVDGSPPTRQSVASPGEGMLTDACLVCRASRRVWVKDAHTADLQPRLQEPAYEPSSKGRMKWVVGAAA